MKRSQALAVLPLAAILLLSLGASDASNAVVQHEFRIEEFQLFHDVLRPLQHEALPQGDFQRIRSMATELVTRGEAIVKLDVPEVPGARPRKFLKVRKKFARWLTRFATDARIGSDAKLKKSFAAVHDSFEQLAELAPAAYPGGDPPTLSLNCPGKAETDSKITLSVDFEESDQLVFIWTIDKGKILTGQRTRTITVDTARLAGQTISVTVTADDGNGHLATTNCKVEIAASQQSQPFSGVGGIFVRP